MRASAHSHRPTTRSRLRKALATVLQAALLAAAAPAQDPAATAARERPLGWLVIHDAQAVPDRLAALAEVRSRARGAEPAGYAASIAALEAAHAPAHDALSARIAALGGRVERRFLVLPGVLATLPPGAESAVAAWPEVAAVHRESRGEPHIRRSTDAANHAADIVHARPDSGRGAGVTLALLDSGIDAACTSVGGAPHPAFTDGPPGHASRLRAVLDFAGGDGEDRDGHGTAIAAIAAGRAWSPGVAESDDGFAPAADIASLKISDGPGNSYAEADLLAAIDEIARQRVSWNAVVANLSWSGSSSPLAPAPRALDDLAWWFDVCVVASAGNDGLRSNPSARSMSVANGLSVVAVDPDTHRLWPRSSYGPLLDDPLRPWPDLAAVGTGLRTPRPDQHQAASAPLTGTSFAAPAVAGTALLIRERQPQFTALDARILLLHGAADLTRANPDHGRWQQGHGLLRADLAFESAVSDNRIVGLASGPQWQLDQEFDTGSGGSFVVTLGWPRLDSGRFDWDDLDLQVLALDGTEVGQSRTRRSLSEQVVFDAGTGGRFRVVVTAETTPILPLPLVIWTGPNRGGLRQPGAFRTIDTDSACPASAVDPLQALTVPVFSQGRFGNARSAYPLAGEPCRMQVIVDGANLQAGAVIDRIALRRDERTQGVPDFDVDVEVWLSATTASPTLPDDRFDRNLPAPPPAAPAMSRRMIRVPGGALPPADATATDIVLPLDAPYGLTQSSPGVADNLLIEFRVFGHSRGAKVFGYGVDAEIDGRSVAVIAIGDPAAPRGILDPLTPTLALLGPGTPRGSTPRLQVERPPNAGRSFGLWLHGAPPGTPAALLTGSDNDTWGGGSLPFAFDPIGAPGCALAVRPDVVVPLPTHSSTGHGVLDLLIPAGSAAIGLNLRQQAVLLDPGANALGLATTAAHLLRVDA